MLHCLQQELPAINVAEQRDIGGRCRHALQMRHQPISSDALSAETLGEAQIKSSYPTFLNNIINIILNEDTFVTEMIIWQI